MPHFQHLRQSPSTNSNPWWLDSIIQYFPDTAASYIPHPDERQPAQAADAGRLAIEVDSTLGLYTSTFPSAYPLCSRPSPSASTQYPAVYHSQLDVNMPLDVDISPRWAAIGLAQAAEKGQRQANACVLHIFCDGSFKPFKPRPHARPQPRSGIGIVLNVCLPHDGKMRRSTKACFLPHSPTAGNHSIEAFALAEGAYVAIDHISTLIEEHLVRSTDKFEVVFWSDSKRALGGLQTPKLYPEDARRMAHILDIIELKVLELEALVPDISVKFRWCPGECVEPHAFADEISKNVRISGGGTSSKALALFRRMSLNDMKSALRRARLVPASIHPAGVGSVPMKEDTESSVPENVKTTTGSSEPRSSPHYPAVILDPVQENVKTTISHPQTSPRYPAVILDPAVRAITEDPVIMNKLHQAAGSSHFFSIIGGMIECLPLDLRANMQKAVHEQQDANKEFQFFIKGLSNKRDEQHERSSLAHYPNLFAFIEMATFKLPADQQEPVLAAIGLQKEANAYRVQGEAAGGVYESRASEEVDVRREPEVLETKGLEKPMDFDESNIIEEPKAAEEHMVLDGPMVLDQPKTFEEVKASEAKVPEESKGPAKAKVLDELMDRDEPVDLDGHVDLDGLTMIEAVELSEESKVLENPEAFEEPEALENLVALEEPEVFEEPTGTVQESENTEEPARIVEEPARIIEEPTVSEPKALGAPMDLDDLEVLDEHIIEEPKAAEEPAYINEEAFQNTEILENPEAIEEARPSRIRSVWTWVERTLQRL